jgi:hypothetical protein
MRKQEIERFVKSFVSHHPELTYQLLRDSLRLTVQKRTNRDGWIYTYTQSRSHPFTGLREETIAAMAKELETYAPEDPDPTAKPPVSAETEAGRLVAQEVIARLFQNAINQ